MIRCEGAPVCDWLILITEGGAPGFQCRMAPRGLGWQTLSRRNGVFSVFYVTGIGLHGATGRGGTNIPSFEGVLSVEVTKHAWVGHDTSQRPSLARYSIHRVDPSCGAGRFTSGMETCDTAKRPSDLLANQKNKFASLTFCGDL